MSKEENFKLFCELRGQEVEFKFRGVWIEGKLVGWSEAYGDNYFQVSEDGAYNSNVKEIRPIKKPEYKPWTAETIPFPLAVRGKDWVESEYALISGVYHDSVSYRWNGTNTQVSFKDLLIGFETRDGQPCGEVVGE